MNTTMETAFKIESLFHQGHYEPDYTRIMTILEEYKNDALKDSADQMMEFSKRWRDDAFNQAADKAVSSFLMHMAKSEIATGHDHAILVIADKIRDAIVNT